MPCAGGNWVGSPCGLHGPYVFYKAFRFHLDAAPRILSLGDFFFVRCKPGEPICVAELQLLWEERTSGQLLSSSKLYFLPEDTPQGRTVSHGEDEVMAVSEKVIVKLEDLAKWTVCDASGWPRGTTAVPLKPTVLRELGKNGQRESLHKYRESTLNSGLNFKDVLKEKAELGDDGEEKKVLVLSYPQYCRYRSIIARLRERPTSLLTDHVVLALGGIASLTNNTQILYCRDTFEHPTLIENESVCDEFAPNLKGRPRKKKLSVSQRRDSQGQSAAAKDASSAEATKTSAKVKAEQKAMVAATKHRTGGGAGGNSSCKKVAADEHPKSGEGEECRAEEQAFLVSLYKYMKERKTPIERIPYLGFKQINLWTMFQAAQKLGGYELITARRQWKNVYDELGGNPGSTSAATCTRRHYERLILPYERFTKGEEDKPLPPVKPRKQETGTQEGGVKTKLAAMRRPKEEQNARPRAEKDASLVKGPEPSPGLEDKDSKIQDQEDACQKLDSQRETERRTSKEEDNELQLTVKNETESCGTEKVLHSRGALWDGGRPDSANGDNPAMSQKSDGEEDDSGAFPVTPPSRLLNHSLTQNQWQQGLPEFTVGPPSTLGNTDHTGLKENPGHVGMVLPTLQPIRSQDSPTDHVDAPIHTPLLYPKSNPGIMSPLAKKKMLSQVSGTSQPNNYGPPPPLIHRKTSSAEDPPGGQTGSQASIGADVGVINRPSVIQHAQSFKPRSAEDRRASTETCPSESYLCDASHRIPQPQVGHAIEPYLLRVDPHIVEKSGEMPRPGHAPSFLSDFYSSPHLHNLYRQTEHHLNKDSLSKYLSRESFPRDHESSQAFPSGQHSSNSVGLVYSSSLKDRSPPEEQSTEDQPTDLSLPKPAPSKLASSIPSICGLSHPIMQQDLKSTPLYQPGTGQNSGLDYHPRACRVPPMTVSTPKKSIDSHTRALEKSHSGRQDDTLGYKIEEIVRPILGTKSSPQNIGAARPLKRNLEELESGPPEKKIRAVTPMHCSAPKDTAGKTRTPEPEVETVKLAEPVHAVHINSYAMESHKFPLHAPIFPGLYPGAFVSQVQDMCDSLGPNLPTSYSHPLQYLKNQAVISPLMPPFAIHSFMMQRQLLAQAASPAHLYRHPVGAAYGDLLHHSLYPMSTLNPQPNFSPPQLSSVHPSTKLS
ncbi:AT-rich interactive domain-containing protein 5B isoform X2 [Denticeps clupeoides]|uniref:AT-rich interactive domain-containing protein 5B n=1 Tax=Denticeps clupeoides TaxID=299321 RepID=A0AAY4ABT7_9TELE|nr:AT-rich interactive domain-containing protein 5B isoform X2 [Denticeps clupeoides]